MHLFDILPAIFSRKVGEKLGIFSVGMYVTVVNGAFVCDLNRVQIALLVTER